MTMKLCFNQIALFIQVLVLLSQLKLIVTVRWFSLALSGRGGIFNRSRVASTDWSTSGLPDRLRIYSRHVPSRAIVTRPP